MKNRLFIWMVLLSFLTTPLAAQSYDAMWKKVEEQQKKDLPKSVIESAYMIYKEAKKKQNVPQMMKAYLTMMDMRSQIAPDSLVTDLKYLETWAKAEPDSVNRAVLHNVLGELCFLDDEFSGKGIAYLMESVRPTTNLEKSSAVDYVPLTELGKTSKRYEGNRLYPILMRRVISSLESRINTRQSDADTLKKQIENCYRTLLDFYLRNNYRSAYVLCYLDAMQARAGNAFITPDIYQKLIAQYGDVETCAEVYLRYSQYQDNKDEALDSLRVAVRKYAQYPYINKLKNMITEITTPYLYFNVSGLYPGKEQSFIVRYNNLSNFKIEIYRTKVRDVSKVATYDKKDAYWKDKWAFYRSDSFQLTKGKSCNMRSDTLKLMIPEEGYYLFKAVPTDAGSNKYRMDSCLVYVSSLGMLVSRCLDSEQHALVIDRATGAAIPNAKVDFYERTYGRNMSYRLVKSGLRSDAAGLIRWNLDSLGLKKRDMYVRATVGGHQCMPLEPVDINRSVYNRKVTKSLISLFSDLTIYRPGQTIYVSGIAYCNSNDSSSVEKEKKVQLELCDTNNKVISEATLRTNDFGSFHTTFVLPDVCLPGNYIVVAKGSKGEYINSIGVKVEYYKRPMFKVEILPIDVPYKAGDNVIIKGIAERFTGVPVQNAQVKYKLTYADLHRSWNSNVSHLQEGIVQTDSVGNFVVDVKLDSVANVRYTCDVEVTTEAGDTQTGTISFVAERSPFDIRFVGQSNVWIKENPQQIQVAIKNAAGCFIQKEVRYEAFELSDNGSSLKNEQSLSSGVIMSNTSFVPQALYQLPSGNYRLRLIVEDKGVAYKDSINFSLLSITDTKVPAGMNLFVYAPDKEFGDKTPNVYVGTSMKDVTLFYAIYTEKNCIESGIYQLSDSIACISYPYKESYGKSIIINYAFVKEGKLYSEEIRLAQPEVDKKLTLKWETFRDKLQAGKQETWKLRVIDAKGQSVNSEFLATLYDASLDKLAGRRNWFLQTTVPTFKLYISSPCFDDISEAHINVYFNRSILPCDAFSYSSLNTICGFYPRTMYLTGGKVMAVQNTMKLMAKANVAEPLMSARAYGFNEESASLKDEVVSESEEEVGNRSTELRKNFAETAFFYPQLRSDKEGCVSLVFTLPESLTTWRFMGLAHTKEMYWGVMDTTVVAQKDFMLQTNLPRFVRMGDRTAFVATLSNISNKPVKGKVRIELFDPMSEKVFYTDKQSFQVESGKTMPVSFNVEIGNQYQLMGCRMMAEGEMYSDGEQCLLPVLSNKEWITESVSVSMDKAGTKSVDLSSLFNRQSETATNRKLTVEFTGNPAWLAVLALPSIGTPSQTNAISLSAAIYSASLASWIVNQHPEIQKMFESWKAHGNSKEVFLSELQKNEELKDLLLEASPFLLDAQTEEEQRRRMASLFDVNTLQNQNSIYLEKLMELQASDGGWCWFKGMNSSLYVTMEVVETLLRLNQLTGIKLADNKVDQAMGFLEKHFVELYEQMRKQKEVDQVYSEFAARFLYILYLRDMPIDKKIHNAYHYFVERLKKESVVRSIYGKAIAAIILGANNEKKAMDEYLQSLLEYSVYTPEMGRYYDSPKAESTWADYRIPTQCSVIEALRNYGNATEEVNQMRQWLLKQKQVQSWETPINTVNAVYALLIDNASLLKAQTMPKLALDNESISTEKASLGLNSIKESYTLRATEEAPKTFTVSKEEDGVAWGAVYAQYAEDMDKLSNQSEGLAVHRTLFVERMVNGRKQWVELQDGELLHVGDKLKSVMKVKSDRDMDFIQIKEGRASCLEPLAVVSGYYWDWQSRLGYYRAIKDAFVEYYMDKMKKGTCSIETLYYVTLSGKYEMGCVKVQSAYSPEFNAHTSGKVLTVETQGLVNK